MITLWLANGGGGHFCRIRKRDGLRRSRMRLHIADLCRKRARLKLYKKHTKKQTFDFVA